MTSFLGFTPSRLGIEIPFLLVPPARRVEITFEKPGELRYHQRSPLDLTLEGVGTGGTVRNQANFITGAYQGEEQTYHASSY